MSLRREILLLLISLVLVACGGTDFSGGGSKAAAPADKPRKEKQESSSSNEEEQENDEDSADAEVEEDDPEVDSDSEPKLTGPAASTPEDPIDVKDSGFTCLDDMSVADGPWAGTFKGFGTSFTPGNAGRLEVKGTVDFQMVFQSKGVLGITSFNIEGGMQGIDQIRSYEPNMELRCGDGSFKPTTVDHAGHELTVTLAFTHQSWNPPTLRGTWTAKDFLMEWASGDWEVALKK